MSVGMRFMFGCRSANALRSVISTSNGSSPNPETLTFDSSGFFNTQFPTDSEWLYRLVGPYRPLLLVTTLLETTPTLFILGYTNARPLKKYLLYKCMTYQKIPRDGHENTCYHFCSRKAPIKTKMRPRILNSTCSIRIALSSFFWI